MAEPSGITANIVAILSALGSSGVAALVAAVITGRTSGTKPTVPQPAVEPPAYPPSSYPPPAYPPPRPSSYPPADDDAGQHGYSGDPGGAV